MHILKLDVPTTPSTLAPKNRLNIDVYVQLVKLAHIVVDIRISSNGNLRLYTPRHCVQEVML